MLITLNDQLSFFCMAVNHFSTLHKSVSLLPARLNDAAAGSANPPVIGYHRHPGVLERCLIL